MSIKIFYSYSHKDERLRNKLDNHLALLERQGVIKGWNDRMIEAGDDWQSEINENLNSAGMILLLVSDDFIASDYCYSLEMKRALEREEKGEALVVPIILRPVDWESSPFAKLQALPKDGKAVTLWSNRDSAFKNIAQGIRRLTKQFKPKTPTSYTSTFIPRPPVIGFVARRDANGQDIVERLKEMLAPGQNRLVTLSGPGGVGKSTLAAETARELRDAFKGRVVWSGAGGRADYTLSTLLDDISTQLGHEELRPLAPAAKEAQVQALIAEPPTFVVLDNYETIKPDAQQRIEEWFTAAQCSALLTSRPRVGGVGTTVNVPIAAMSPAEAQEFLERMIAQTQDAQIFSDEVRQRIYETAEANPFVMQWVVAQIDEAQEPQTVFEELRQGEGDAAQRVFDRSFNLEQLGDDGRAALLALSLFAPNATREALAAVAGFSNDSRRVGEAVKNLRALWLIKAIDENRRFAVEGLTRSLAAARISKDPRAAEFRQRFVAYFLTDAEAHKQRTPEDYDVLEAERENLLSAIEAASDSGDWQSVQNLAGIVAEPVNGALRVRGYWDDVIRCNEQAAAAAREMNDEGAIARFSTNIAAIRLNRGEYDEARQAYQQALVTCKKLGEDNNVAVVLHQLGRLAQNQGEIEEAQRHYNESLEIKKRLDNQNGIANTLHQLGRLALEQGEIEEARRLYNESLEIAKRLGDQSGIAITLHNLAVLAQNQGKVKEARRLYNESLEIKKRLGNQNGIAITLHNLAMLAQGQGELEEARRLYNESLEIKKRLGNQSGIATTLHQLGGLAEQEGNREEAVRLVREALGIYEKLKSPKAEKARRDLEMLEGESS